MNSITKKILYTLFFILPAFFTEAQILSLEQCREMALKNSREIQIAEKTIEKAQAEKAAAQSYRLPSVSATATGIYLKDNIESDMYLPTVTPDLTSGEMTPNIMTDPTGQPIIGSDGNPVFNLYAWLPLEISMQGAYMAGVSIEQAVYTGGKISSGNKMAELGIGLAGFNFDIKKMECIAEADQSYWLFVSVNEKVKLAKEAVDALTRLLKKVSDANETGMIAKNEVLKVQVQLNKAKLDLQKAQSGLKLTRMSLCRVTGLPLDSNIMASDTLVDYSNKLLNKFGGETVINRPEYKALDQNIKMQEENVKLVRSDYLPVLGVSAGYNYLGGAKISGSNFGQGNAMLLASLNIPVFHWGQGKNKIASAKADKEIKELELDKNVQLLKLQIEQAKLNMQDAFLRIKMSETALEQSEENLRVSNDNYELGFETLSDLLIARLERQKAFSELIDAKTDFKMKETQYLKVTGNLKNE